MDSVHFLQDKWDDWHLPQEYVGDDKFRGLHPKWILGPSHARLREAYVMTKKYGTLYFDPDPQQHANKMRRFQYDFEGICEGGSRRYPEPQYHDLNVELSTLCDCLRPFYIPPSL